MVHVFTTNISRIIGLFFVTFVSALLTPGFAIADSEIKSCAVAHLQIEHTQSTLQTSEQRQQQLQHNVRTTYQQLFACKTGTALSLAQQHYCTQLQEDGPKQFQAMVDAITLSHQTSQQLANQTHQATLNCPENTEETSPQIF